MNAFEKFRLVVKKPATGGTQQELHNVYIELRRIMATQEEIAAQLAAVKEQLVKASAEINAKIQALVDAVAAAGGASPEVEAATADLKAVAQSLDDIGDPNA